MLTIIKVALLVSWAAASVGYLICIALSFAIEAQKKPDVRSLPFSGLTAPFDLAEKGQHIGRWCFYGWIITFVLMAGSILGFMIIAFTERV